MSKTFVRLSFAGVLLACLTVGRAVAQPADMRTFFTFSGPVSVPGVTLPAGKYLFRLVDSSHRDVIQVVSGNGKTPYAMFFALRARRADIPREPQVSFMETALGMPRAIRTWWYPGERTGYEFVYPKRQARLLAKGTGEPILTTLPETTTAPETRVAELARITPSGEATPVAETAPAPAPPSGPIETGELAPATIPIAEPALPKTASATPSIALAGLLLLLGTAFIGGWRVLRA